MAERSIESLLDEIKAYKQAIEKIRAEIEQYKEKGLSEFKVCYWDYVRAIDTSLSIIDKYIGEKEK